VFADRPFGRLDRHVAEISTESVAADDRTQEKDGRENKADARERHTQHSGQRQLAVRQHHQGRHHEHTGANERALARVARERPQAVALLFRELAAAICLECVGGERVCRVDGHAVSCLVCVSRTLVLGSLSTD
jgi:hypothetical protein